MWPCPACKEAHYLGRCPQFQAMKVSERKRLAQAKHLCFTCLSGTHVARGCPSTSSCRSCGLAHHTLLHDETSKRAASSVGSGPYSPSKQPRRPVTVAATTADADFEDVKPGWSEDHDAINDGHA